MIAVVVTATALIGAPWAWHAWDQALLRQVLSQPEVRAALRPLPPPPPLDPRIGRLLHAFPGILEPLPGDSSGDPVCALAERLRPGRGPAIVDVVVSAMRHDVLKTVLQVLPQLARTDALGEDAGEILTNIGCVASMGVAQGDPIADDVLQDCIQLCLVERSPADDAHRTLSFAAVTLLTQEMDAILIARRDHVLPAPIWERWTAHPCDETVLFRALLRDDLSQSILNDCLVHLQHPQGDDMLFGKRRHGGLSDWCRGGHLMVEELLPLVVATRCTDWRQVPAPPEGRIAPHRHHARHLRVNPVLEDIRRLLPLPPALDQTWSCATVANWCRYLRQEGERVVCMLDGRRWAVLAADQLLTQAAQGRMLPAADADAQRRWGDLSWRGMAPARDLRYRRLAADRFVLTWGETHVQIPAVTAEEPIHDALDALEVEVDTAASGSPPHLQADGVDRASP